MNRNLWLPVAGIATVLLVGVVLRVPASFEQPGLLTTLNLIFLTVLPGAVAILAIPAYRATGVLAVAIFGAAMAATALGAGLVPALLVQVLGANAVLTMHNTAVLVAGMLFVASSVMTVLGYGPVRARARDVAVPYAAVMAVLALILIGILTGAIPAFVTPGGGFTPLRQAVLGLATVALGAATLIWWQIAARSPGVPFLRWYVPALALFAIGLLAILAQRQVGGVVGWTGRAAQYLAGVYFFGAIWTVWSRKQRPHEAARQLGLELLQASLPYREVVDAASEGIVALARDGTILYWNGAADRLLGLEGADVVGVSFVTRFLPPEARDTTQGSGLVAALTASTPVPSTYQLSLATGGAGTGRLPAELAVAVVRGGRIRVVSIRDIGERLAATIALEASELRYRAIVEDSVDGVLVSDASARCVEANPAMCRMLGYARDEILAMRLGELIAPDDPNDHGRMDALVAGASGEAGIIVERRYRRRDGSSLPVEVSIRVLPDGRQQLNARDISDRVASQTALRASEERFRTLVEQSPDAMFITSADEMRILAANAAAYSLLGYEGDELIGQHISGLVPTADRAAQAQRLADLSAGRVLRSEVRIVRRDGALVDAEIAHVVLPDGRIVSTIRDVSERKAAETALRRTTELLTATEAIARVGGWQLDVASSTLYWTDETYRIHELTPDEYTPAVATAIAWYAPESRAVISAAVEAAIAHGTPYDLELELVTAAGRRIWVRATCELTVDAGGRTVTLTGALQDISARKAAEDERARLFAAIEHAPDPLLLMGPDARIVYANHALEAMTGYGHGALTGRPSSDLGGPGIERLVPGISASLTTGRPWTGEITAPGADGATFTLEWTIAPVRDDTGTLLGYIASARDRSGEKALEAQLAQAGRLEAVGQLAGGIAHDFNNLLTAVRGYAELIERALPDDSPARADVEQVIGAADRAAALTRGLLAFSRRQILAPRVLDPADVVTGIVPLLRRLLGEHIELAAVVTPGRGAIKIDPSQLEQVVVNLAVNARDAMAGGGRLTIELRDVDLDAAYASAHAEAAAGPHVLLAISDTGSGMDAATQARIFEPFFTTKEQGKGTGMGLAVVYGIVRQSGGSIYVYSEPGHGTSFKLYFPRVAADVDPGPAATPATAQGGDGETILLVEDESAVRGFAVRALTAVGYRVLEAGSGAQALELAAAQERQIDLLVTDIVMPGLQGHQLAEQLGAAWPGLRVLYVSGFTENSVIHHGVPDEGAAFLAKPFSAGELATAVRAALDRPA